MIIDDPYVRSAFMGLLQGVTEFLPVSSSGHLVLFGMDEEIGGLPAVVAYHAASLLAMVVVFRRRFLALVRPRPAWKTLGMMALASVPVGVVGLTFKERLDELTAHRDASALTVVGAGLIGTGVVLVCGALLARRQQAGPMTLPRLIGMALAQAVAIIPGVSRSGSTISVGMAYGVEASEAVEWSFLMAAPAIFGALLLVTKDALEQPDTVPWGPLGIGSAVCFVASLAALYVLVGMVRKRRLALFALYTIPAGMVSLYLAWTF